MLKPKYLVTIQEPHGIRHRCIILAHSSFEAVAEMMEVGLDPNTYISAKPASVEDVKQYGQIGVHV
jgi:hypothetical protein